LVRSQSWQDEVLKKPLNERIKLAEDLRKKSLKETKSKREIIMDVNQKEVDKYFLKYNVDLMIHGHTHRPNIHVTPLNGSKVKRIVLGDWYNSSFILKYQKDKVLIEKNSFC
jgi:UDP-2,3-diacylglucosamine hydrolase